MAGERWSRTSLRAEESAVVRVGRVSRDSELVVVPAGEEDSASAVAAAADGSDRFGGHPVCPFVHIERSARRWLSPESIDEHGFETTAI
jgi:hypothetical protein